MNGALRLALFIDAQNTYKGAREAFFPDGGHYTDGQTDPRKIAELIASRGAADGSHCAVSSVTVYTGYSDSSKDPKGYGAHRRQRAFWIKRGVNVTARPLRYPFDPTQKPQEKGVDVAIALDIAKMALNKEFDIGVLFSTDTDLLPAIEFVREHCDSDITMTTAAWKSPTANRSLWLPGLWCHRLTEVDFRSVSDLTNYTR